MPGRKIVEDNDAFAGIDQVVHHLAADIARAASDQNCHFASSGEHFARGL